ncbi:MAG: HXXEE domain-containing protein [Bacteroidota bacterium]
MKAEKFVLASILLLYLMLWTPLGQFRFLVDHWMKIGVYAVPFLLIGSFAFLDEKKPSAIVMDFRFIGVILLIAYIIHQFEEHWIDLYGNYYAFYTSTNNLILEKLGQSGSSVKPLTKESIFVINTSLVWLVGLLAILRSPRHLFPLFAMASIVFINGLVHLLAGILNYRYNPGLLTSMVLFIPVYFWVLKQIRNRVPNYRAHVVYGLIWAFLGHVIMMAGFLAANWFKVIPEFLYWVVLVIWSILPIAILRKTSLS